MKLDLILENVRNKYTMGLLEESGNITETELLKGKILINESTMEIRKMLVEEGTLSEAREILEESWIEALIEESAYQDYFDKKLKASGYKDVKSIPKDEKKEFFDKIDAGWKSKDEK